MTTPTQPADPRLWRDIMSFDFDHPISEYGFTTRLIHENLWTSKFAERAILEYKKFMYLATVSDSMVSPSPVIDQVWHQHLIFTQSYNSFCKILDKFIQHVPSTHNKEDHLRFKQARETTRNLYAENFGEPPADIWEPEQMLDNLGLPKARLKIRGFVLLGIACILAGIIPLFYLLKPVYATIDGPAFLFGYVVIFSSSLLVLEFSNRSYLRKIIRKQPKDSFLFQLNPAEAVYLRTAELGNAVDNRINYLIESGKLEILPGGIIKPTDQLSRVSPEEFQVAAVLAEHPDGMPYRILQADLVSKPAFTVVSQSMDALNKYFIKSKAFGNLFYKNFIVLAVLLEAGIVRIATGISREKPVLLIFMLVAGFIIVSSFFLHALTKKMRTLIIPEYYKNDILPAVETQGVSEWSYFMIGAAAYHAVFYEIVQPRKPWSDGSSSGSSGCSSGDGGSCGSSCGSSCGGCGGGD